MKDRYWHIQMFLPEGKGGTVIDSSQMLKEEKPVIGTGEWDDIQCQYFKGERNGLAIGDIVMIREGSRPLALCRITGECFHDDSLTSKYINYWFRYVEILEWADPNEWNSLFSQGTLKILYKHSDTPSWHYINDWYKQILQNVDMKKIVDLLQHKKQIILQGAPGTGKTYTAKDIAEQLIFNAVSSDKKEQKHRLESSSQFKLIQFHPSYTYEDFVRGIVVETETGTPNYKTVDKILGEFAKEALRNWKDSKKQPEVLTKEKWVSENLKSFKEKIQKDLENGGIIKLKEDTAPTITDIEDNAFRCNRYNNPQDSILIKDSDIINGYIGLHLDNPNVKIKDNPNLSASARSGMYYLYQNLIALFKKYLDDENIFYKDSGINQQSVSENNFVLIIDEINRANLPAILGELIYALEYRGENVESMYAVDGENKLILPPNLYIIGTMNTADRSVGQIDYAIRRRFAFIDMLPHVLDNVEGFDYDLFEKVSKLFIENYDEYKINPKVYLKRSAYLSEEFRPEDIWLGHSYFIMKKDGNDCRNMRLNYEIKPILKEYLKDGIFKVSAEKEINQLV